MVDTQRSREPLDRRVGSTEPEVEDCKSTMEACMASAGSVVGE